MQKHTTIEQANTDTTLPDTWVQWVGGAVYLWDSRKQTKLLKDFDAHSRVVDKISRYCLNNGLRCTQIRDGRVML